MRIPLEQQGAPFLKTHCLRVSNHVSWLDIVVLYACGSCRFIAKAEIANFPLVGRIAKNANTLFLNRSSIKDAIRMSETVSKALTQGDCVAFFPEGTTSNGTGLLPLHASLFEGAIAAQCPVQGVVVRFHTSDSTRACHDAAYVHTSMIGTLWRILRHGDIKARVIGLEPIEVTGKDERRKISVYVQNQMEATLNHLNYNRGEMLAAAQAIGQGDVTEKSIDFELQNIFFDEAKELIENARAQLPQLKSDLLTPASKQALMQTRQTFHILKGSARMVGYSELGKAAQAVEHCLNGAINAKQPVSDDLVQFTIRSLDQLDVWVKELKQGGLSHMKASSYVEAAGKVR